MRIIRADSKPANEGCSSLRGRDPGRRSCAGAKGVRTPNPVSEDGGTGRRGGAGIQRRERRRRLLAESPCCGGPARRESESKARGAPVRPLRQRTRGLAFVDSRLQPVRPPPIHPSLGCGRGQGVSGGARRRRRGGRPSHDFDVAVCGLTCTTSTSEAWSSSHGSEGMFTRLVSRHPNQANRPPRSPL